jgi:hypothetical protein
MADNLPIVGTLSGTLVGAVAGYAGQWMQAKRIERRQLFDMQRVLNADFMGATQRPLRGNSAVLSGPSESRHGLAS